MADPIYPRTKEKTHQDQIVSRRRGEAEVERLAGLADAEAFYSKPSSFPGDEFAYGGNLLVRQGKRTGEAPTEHIYAGGYKPPGTVVPAVPQREVATRPSASFLTPLASPVTTAAPAATSQEMSQAEFDAAWEHIRKTGTIPPGVIRSMSVGDDTFLSDLSNALLRYQEQIRAEGGYGPDWERAGDRITADQMFRDRVQTEAERAAEIQEAMDRANLGLSDRVWDPNALGGQGAFFTIPPDTLAQRQLTQRGTEATAAEEFRRAQLAEQVTAREAGYRQAELARQQEADLAREAMGVAGPTTYDDLGRPIRVIPDTLAQRQLDADIRARQYQLGEQTTARQREEALTRVAMGLDPTGTMDPSQTLASRQFELDRAFQQQQLALQAQQLGIPTETTYVDGVAIPGRPPDTLAQRQLTQQATEATLAEDFRRAQLAEQVRQADIQAGLIETALPFREFEAEQRRALEAEAIRRIDLNLPLGPELREVLGLEAELDFETYQTGAQREAQRVRTEAAAEALLARTSREEQASMQRDLERTIAEGARGLTTREQDIQRDIAKIGLGLGAEGAQAIPFRQLEEQMRATRRGEELQQSALQGLIGDRETVAGRAQSEAERAALIGEGLERTQVFGGEVDAQGEFTPTLEADLALAGLMGMRGGTRTLAGQAQEEVGRAAKAREDMEQAQLLGILDGTETVTGRAQTEAERAALIREGFTGRAQTEAERAALVREDFERAQLLGVLDGADTLEAQLARAGITGTLDGTATLAGRQLTQQVAESKKERDLRRDLANLQADAAAEDRDLTVSESEKERELRKELVDLQIEESIAERGLTAAEANKERELRRELAALQATEAGEERTLTGAESLKERELRRELATLQIGEAAAGRALTAGQAAEERDLRRELAALQATEAGAGRGLERELGIAQISGMLGEQPTLEAELARRQLTETERAALARERFQRAELFGGFQSPTLEAELGRGQLAQAGETARLNALVDMYTAAMQNPYAFSAMQAMGGGGAPFANLLAPLGFQMPGQVGQGAQQFFPGGLPTMGALGQADPEGLNYLQALLGFSGVSPQQFGRLSAGITPGATMRPAATTGMFRGRRGR